MSRLIKVDNFDNIAFVDFGGYGDVYKVISNDGEPSLALKVLNREHQSWPQSIQSLRNEFEVVRNFE